MTSPLLEFITLPRTILQALHESKDNGTVIGITSPVLGRGTFLTSVNDIIILDDIASSPTIILKPFDANGYFLETNVIKLDDIRSVCVFTSKFENPFMKRLA